MKLRNKALSLVAIGILATGASAEDLYANAFNGANLTLIDSNTGAGTPSVNIGALGWNAMETVGAAFYGTTFTSPSLYTWTFANPTAVLIAQTDDIRGMAYDGTTMWGVRNGGSDELVTIDLNTGSTTLVGAMNFASVQALAINGSTLYAWDINDGLLTVDTNTGLATDVGTAGGTGDIQGMDFGVGGTLFGVRESLYTIDTNTGAFTPVGAGGLGDNRGLVAGAVPEPASFVALGLGGMLLLLRRRR